MIRIMTKMRLYVTTNLAHSPPKRQKDEGASCCLRILPTLGLALVVEVAGSPRTISPQIDAVKVTVGEANFTWRRVTAHSHISCKFDCRMQVLQTRRSGGRQLLILIPGRSCTHRFTLCIISIA